MKTPACLQVISADGHRFELLAYMPEQPIASLLWLPALGVSARNYQAFAEALAAEGIAVFLHEWRGNGSSSLRPDHHHDWGYRELLHYDLPAAEAVVQHTLPGLPLRLGGHSLGGQLSCCYAGLRNADLQALWLVASGTPWWRSFPVPRRYLLPLAYRFLPWLARKRGALPGRRVGFGGTEARSLIRDWARVGLSNHYAADGMSVDLEAGMHTLNAPVTALVFDDDWLAPVSSMRSLLQKMPNATHTLRAMSSGELGTAADHFRWMKAPQAVVAALIHHED
ncbi:alpha/beta fold hydrolase [Stenotrophomonas sp. Iso1]|uniref:alpha/beta hydrolase family protein n=1 Tax=Stenotrophomonas sp. Iso1 TaxID=2977283 RepID=UPI0022B7B2B3|nr:alpha/beta fold hydrolase [Stenotrophomonas sp. Iso1]